MISAVRIFPFTIQPAVVIANSVSPIVSPYAAAATWITDEFVVCLVYSG